MGSTIEPYETKFHNKYNFIQVVNDKNFGTIKVYRKKEINFDYVMILQKHMAKEGLQNFKGELKLIHSSLLLKDEPMILRIFHHQVTEESVQPCSRPSVKLYIEYFNFTLKDLIKSHLQSGQSFTIEEIAYVVRSSIEIYYFFKKFNTNYLSLRSDCIFITPEGFLRFSPIRIQDFYQEASCLCDGICSPETYEVHFQKSQKHFLIELKNLLSEIIALSKNDLNFKNSYELLNKINHSKNVENVQQFLYWPEADSLSLTKKQVQSTQISTNRDKYYGVDNQMKSKYSLKQSSSNSEPWSFI